ncbi:hypothetical protein AB4084_28060, partial [Lysobacter sp. 2RAB21]
LLDASGGRLGIVDGEVRVEIGRSLRYAVMGQTGSARHMGERQIADLSRDRTQILRRAEEAARTVLSS